MRRGGDGIGFDIYLGGFWVMMTDDLVCVMDMMSSR